MTEPHTENITQAELTQNAREDIENLWIQYKKILTKYNANSTHSLIAAKPAHTDIQTALKLLQQIKAIIKNKQTLDDEANRQRDQLRKNNKFSAIGEFKYNRATAYDNQGGWIINADGTKIAGPYETLFRDTPNGCWIQKHHTETDDEDLMGTCRFRINMNGEILSGPWTSNTGMDKHQRAIVEDMYGTQFCINDSGEIIAGPYDQISQFQNEIAYGRYHDNEEYFDVHGNKTEPENFDKDKMQCPLYTPIS